MLTLVRFLSRVDTLVQEACGDVAETLPTLVTAVGFLSSVDALMLSVVG